MNWNQNINDAPIDGTELIFWIEGHNGLGDITANGYWSNAHFSQRPPAAGWFFSDSHRQIKQIIKGWMLYPQPPESE